MGQVRHGSATTKHAVRAAYCRKKTKPLSLPINYEHGRCGDQARQVSFGAVRRYVPVVDGRRARVPVLPEDVAVQIERQRRAAKACGGRTEDTIHIVLAIDEAYVPHAAVTIASALRHAQNPNNYAFHILEDGSLSKRARATLHQTAKEAADLSFIAVDVSSLGDLPLNREYISRATYYRLVMHNALPQDVKKILYIDADTVVADSLELLWEVELAGHPIGACADEGGLTQSARLGLPDEHIYFNAGVIIFDLTALRNMHFLARVAEAFEANAANITLQDQDLLNLVFCGDTMLLPLRWNANTRLFVPSELEAAYSDEDALAAASAPGILHFTDRRKPWMSKDLNPMGYLYWAHRNRTPWRETFVEKAKRVLIKCARHIFSRSQRAMDSEIKALREQKS